MFTFMRFTPDHLGHTLTVTLDMNPSDVAADRKLTV